MLEKAKTLGYAESDPTDDIEGYDAVRKLGIMMSIATNSEIKPEEIHTEGISQISQEDIAFFK